MFSFWRLLTVNYWFRYELPEYDLRTFFVLLFFFKFWADFWENTKLSGLHSYCHIIIMWANNFLLLVVYCLCWEVNSVESGVSFIMKIHIGKCLWPVFFYFFYTYCFSLIELWNLLRNSHSMAASWKHNNFFKVLTLHFEKIKQK